MLRGMPRDFDELVQNHKEVLEKAAPDNPLEVAHHLWYRGVLATFQAPEVMTRTEVIEYLGIPTTTWRRAARSRPHVLPQPVEGKLLAACSKYRTSDVQRCYESRDTTFPRTNRLGFFVSRIPGFDEFLGREAQKIVDEMACGYIFDLPLHLPQNDSELVARYATTIARVVRCHLKFGTGVTDAINEIWVRFFTTNILIKFMRSGLKRLPAQLSTDDALDFLGVDWEDWQGMMKTHAGAPTPLKGSSESLDAVYRTEDIMALETSNVLRKRYLRYLPVACVSSVIFDRYVERAAENTLLNLFRTLDRRFNREDTLQEGACIQDNRRVRQLRRDEPDLAWEDTLRSDDISVESLIDIKRRVIQEEGRMVG